MKNIIILSFLFLFSGVSTLGQADNNSRNPFFVNEKIVYSIKKMGVKAGEATLFFKGETEIENRNVYLVIFTAKALNFYDEEKIFIDKNTFLPIRVERDLNIFGKKEKILELYETAQDRIRIIKTVKGKTEEKIIKKKGFIDNIYCFIYRYRLKGAYKMGDVMDIHLPTQDVSVHLIRKNKLKTAGQVYDTYYMQSKPKKYKLWFDSSSDKIPLRIDGAVGFGSTSMIMVKYQQ